MTVTWSVGSATDGAGGWVTTLRTRDAMSYSCKIDCSVTQTRHWRTLNAWLTYGSLAVYHHNLGTPITKHDASETFIMFESTGHRAGKHGGLTYESAAILLKAGKRTL
jgi:hypothetical protein